MAAPLPGQDLQSDATLGGVVLVAAGVEPGHLYQDLASGKRNDRLGLAAALKASRRGDALVAWKLDRLGCDLRHLVYLVHWLDHANLTARTAAELAVGFRDELRRRKIIVPGITIIERPCAAALTRCERAVLARLAEGLDREQGARLDALLDIGPSATRTWLGGFRQPPGAASAATIERLRHVRGIRLEAERERLVLRHHLVRLVREGERLSLNHLRGMPATRRRGILVATMLELGPRLTDEALDVHDKLVGRMFRRTERRQLATLSHDRRLIIGPCGCSRRLARS